MVKSRQHSTSRRVRGAALALSGILTATALMAAEGNSAPQAESRVAAAAAMFGQYCLTCHSPDVAQAGVVIDTSGLESLGSDGSETETWERVVRQLESGAMPPAGMPRPGQGTYDSVRSYLETELDAYAFRNPNPGPLPRLRRLTRTEYQNAIRDLVALEHLPQELDFSLLLPADNTSSGFDNIADLLFVSPVTMERYVEAARKISRLAVGDPTMPPMVNIHPLPLQLSQDARVDDLPFGTRGGLAVRSYFPLDAQYVVEVELSSAPREPTELEISIDGAQVQLATLEAGTGRRGVGAAAPKYEFRIPVSAGPHLLGVTFVEPNQALEETLVRPRQRSRGSRPSLASMTLSGPFEATGPGQTPSRERIFVCRPANPAQESPCAAEIISTLVRRAYRRPASYQDLTDLMPFFEAGRAEAGFEYGIQHALERLLVSPQFLYRIERDPPDTPPGTVYPISDLELASRLSFFLWSSIPDDELLGLAAAGRLGSPQILELQVERMLEDPRSASLVTNFASQWLSLRGLEDVDPDLFLFRDFDLSLKASLATETEMFLDSVLGENISVLELLRANYTFLNERLAEHYGVENVEGSYFRRISFPPGSPRGGLLGQGSILALTSYATRTSPVLRGKYILENLLASPPPPPPADVPALRTEDQATGARVSMRDALVAHRANPECAGCHARMDPIGFSMENFDAVGRWRERENGSAIDASGVLPGGRRFEGVQGLREILLDESDRFVAALTEKLMMYAIGRNIQYYDAPAIRTIVREAADRDSTFAALIQGVVRSTPFRMRQAVAQ